MPTIAALTVDLEAGTGKFVRDLTVAERAVTSRGARMNRMMVQMDRTTGRMTRGLGRFAKSLLRFPPLLGAAFAGGLVIAAQRAIEFADSIGKTADKVGVGVESLQELRFAAELAGLDVRTTDLALQRFSRRVGEAVQGTGELEATLSQYNVQLVDAQGQTRNVVDILLDYADAVAAADSSQEQLRLAFKAFDSEGAAFVNLMRKGSDEIRETMEQARRLGIVMNNQMVRAAEKANDQLAIMGRTLQVNLTQLFVGLAPTIVRIGAAFRDAAPHIRDFFDAFLPDELRSSDSLRLQIQEMEKTALQLRAKLDSPGLGPNTELNIRERLHSLDLQISRLRELQTEAAKAEDAVKTGLEVTIAKPGVSDAKKSASDTLEKRIRELQLERQLVGATTAQKAQLQATEQALNTVRAAGGTITTDLTNRYLQESHAVGILAQELEKAQEAQQRMEQLQQALASAVSSSFAQMAADGRKFKEVMRGLLVDIQKAIFEATLTSPLKSLIGNAFGGFLSGGFGSLFGPSFTTGNIGGLSGTPTITNSFGTFTGLAGRASGGPVQAGVPFEVGERGREVFVPSQDGVIVPNHALGRGGRGGGGVVIHQTFDLRGADEGVFARFAKFKEEIKSETVAAVANLMNDGGTFARASGRRR